MLPQFTQNTITTVKGRIGIVDAYLTSYLWKIAQDKGKLRVIVTGSIYSQLVPVSDLVAIVSALECVLQAEPLAQTEISNTIPFPEASLVDLSCRHLLSGTPTPQQAPLNGPNKCVGIEELLTLYGDQPRNRQFPLIAVSGCFDVFRAGHGRLISNAHNIAPDGRLLAITLSDRSISKQSKNVAGDRPIYPQDCRVRMLSSLRAVDHVLVLDSLNCIEALETLGVDFFVKSVRDLDRSVVMEEAKLVERRGGKSLYTQEAEQGKSTTRFLEKVRKFSRIEDIKIN